MDHGPHFSCCPESYSLLTRCLRPNSLTFQPLSRKLLLSVVCARFHINLHPPPPPVSLPVLNLKKPLLFRSGRVEASTDLRQQVTCMNKQRPSWAFSPQAPRWTLEEGAGPGSGEPLRKLGSRLPWRRLEHGDGLCVTLANARRGERGRGERRAL